MRLQGAEATLLKRGWMNVRNLLLLLALTTAAASTLAAPAMAASALGFKSFSAGAFNQDGTPSTQAGAHPWELKTSFTFNTVPDPRVPIEVPSGALKETIVDLPPGALGNPKAVEQCTQAGIDNLNIGCPVTSQVGYAEIDLNFIFGRVIKTVPIYNMVPPPGEPAQFGFVVIASITHIDINVRNDGDIAGGYGATATVHNINGAAPIYGATIHIWGVPASSTHDPERSSASALPRIPFLRNPTACTGPSTTTIRATSWAEPGEVVAETSTAPEATGCASVPFSPTASLTPDSRQTGSSAGYAIDLNIPQEEGAGAPQNEDPVGLATSDLKKVVMTLPKGVAINPGSADGLAGCGEAEFAVTSADKDTCPNASKIASVEIETPLLDKPLDGSIFLATPLEQNAGAAANGRMYRLFLEGEGSGVRIKRIGTVVPDPATGQLTATFDDNPQLPFENLRVELNSGPRAPLTTPKACGTYTTVAELTPWARPTEPVTARSSFTIDEGCNNASKFEPGLEAGTTNPLAGKSSPFVLRITEPSGQQNLAQIQTTLPEGVLAKLKGVALCGDAAAATGECPAASQVGTTVVGAGQGTSPIYVPQPGKAPTAVYLAGPYKGAPYSLAVKVPAQAGPFDLGTVTVRNGLYVDPTTTQVTAKSDPLPQILLGVPISYRDVRVEIDRPDFTLNPTSCEPMKVTSTLTSIEGATANPSDRFQVAGCGELGFKPSLAISLKGKMKRTGNPALTAVLKAPKGQANIAKTTVILPGSEFIDNAHINNPCTRVQFNEGKCPKGSILGTARAYSPLLDKPLSGPVYFRSNGGERELPDLVADLDGQIHVTVVGFIDSVPIKGTESSRVRTRFANVPDAPVSKFVLKMKGGKKGLLANSRDLCSFTPKAKVQMTGQNGKTANSNLKLGTSCGKGAGTAKKHR
jgi:hypothetical protein